MSYFINAAISQAHTLPASFYTNQATYERLINEVFLHSWQWIGDSDLVKENGYCYPFELLQGSLSEPLILSRDQDKQLHCLSNICTHRGNVLVQEAGKKSLAFLQLSWALFSVRWAVSFYARIQRSQELSDQRR